MTLKKPGNPVHNASHHYLDLVDVCFDADLEGPPPISQLAIFFMGCLVCKNFILYAF